MILPLRCCLAQQTEIVNQVLEAIKSEELKSESKEKNDNIFDL